MFHTLLWEYLLEAINEQPSANDLLTTTFAGVALGELCHLATKKMLRNGLTTWEKIAVTIVNPYYVINNGYKRQKFPMR